MKKIIVLPFILAISISVMSQYIMRTFKWDGVQRQYLEYVPVDAEADSISSPVIFCLHGLGASMSDMVNLGFHKIAPNWIVIIPQALMGYFPDGHEAGSAWNSGASAQIPNYGYLNVNPHTDDSGFFMATLDSLNNHYRINTDSVFFMGFSMGGFMSQKMAILHGDRIKGIASVSGTIGNAIAQTIPTGNVNVLHIHGTDDPTVTYENAGYKVRGTFYSVGLGAEQTVEFWRNYNHCLGMPLVTNFPDIRNDGKTFQRYVYKNGLNGTSVALIKVNGGKHEWCYTPQSDIDYVTEIYNFFTNNMNLSVDIVSSPEKQKVD